MITENKIIEVIKDYFLYPERSTLGNNLTYGKSVWMDYKDVENIAKIIIDKIKEEEIIEEIKRSRLRTKILSK